MFGVIGYVFSLDCCVSWLRDYLGTLGVTQLTAHGNLQLKATSIYGEGDKIALPPSVLNHLTQSGNDIASGSPWLFRIGVLNPEYSFPASPSLRSMPVPDEEVDMDLEDAEEEEVNSKEAYLDELSHRYVAYTHGTVVEFTQDEGHVGLPEPIATALLDPTSAQRTDTLKTTVIPSTRTIDPAKAANSSTAEDGDNGAMDVVDVEGDKTPGHMAYGAFDIPDLPIEVVLVHVPKGEACKLVPSNEAISNGFFNLKDIKTVLEQSLVRTRATLSVGDLVHTWHRGVKFDLKVAEVTPSTFLAVACINTDIEVEFGGPPTGDETKDTFGGLEKREPENRSSSTPAFAGYTLGSSTNETPSPQVSSVAPVSVVSELLEEPPSTLTEGICTVLIQGSGRRGRRRFDVTRATVRDLFAFASTVAHDVASFRLVTRFPRRIFSLEDGSSLTLQEAGLESGQELLMIEML